MAATDRISGKNLYVAWHSGGGSTDLSGSQRSMSFEHEQEMTDATAGADTYRVMIPTVRTAGASLEILVESGASGSAIFAAIPVGGAVGTLIWGPEGTTADLPKWGMVARVAKASQEIPFDDVYVISVEFTNAGADLAYDYAEDGDVWP